MPGIADLLGSMDPNALAGLIGNAPMGAPATPMAAPQQAMPQQRPGLFGGGLSVGSPIRNFLGALGDALLVSQGHQPLYQQRVKQQRLSSALSGYLGDIDPGLGAIMEADPETGFALWKAKHPASEVPAALKEFEYYKGLQGGDRSSYENFLKLTHPGMMSPVTLGANDTIEGGGVPDAGEVTATNPATGEKVRLNPQSGQWEPMGGQTASPSGPFPVSKVMDALTAQESGGDGTAVSYKGARGSTQLMPPTAKEMASKLGLAFMPQMLNSNDPKALRYQRALAEAYFTEGLSKHGNLRDALRYYHGGPDTAQWGPKTNAYADAILSRLGGR